MSVVQHVVPVMAFVEICEMPNLSEGIEGLRMPVQAITFQLLEMVEAAGVEPASENVVSKEPTYLVTFMRRC